MAGQHYSHTLFGGIPLTLGKRGIVFTKKPSSYNVCIADELRKGKPGSRSAAKAAFKSAVSKCKR